MEIDKHYSIYEFGCKSFHLLLASSRNANRRKKFFEGHFREDVIALRLELMRLDTGFALLQIGLRNIETAAIVCLFGSVCV